MFDSLIGKYHDLKDRRENGDGGFTLIELLVVVVIIGILIAIAIPLYLNYQKGANDKSSQSDLRAAVSALQQCYSENGNKYPTSVDAASATKMTGSFNFVCSADATPVKEKVNLSDGTQMSFANSGGVVTLMSWNPDGKRDGGGDGGPGADSTKYVYKSDAGGAIK